LRDFADRKLVLYFYPRADTSGCTKEALHSRDSKRHSTAPALTFSASILGVSADPVKALDSVEAKHNLPVVLVSDEIHRTLEAYGVWQRKSMYGRTPSWAWCAPRLIGPDRRMARIWPKVSVAGHAEDVLEAVKML
jgi:thioredoxin-dependent peroxiredoxin